MSFAPFSPFAGRAGRRGADDLRHDDLDDLDDLDDGEARLVRRRTRRRPSGVRRRVGIDDLTGPAPGAPEPEPEPEHSSWGSAQHGPAPRPDWVVTALGAIDRDLGVLKTGKEADVHLLERFDPATGGLAVMAAKRYRDSEHRMFHRDAGYLEGRRVRKSREMRAMARRTAFGRTMIGLQWATAEFHALTRLWELTRPGGADPVAAGRRALVPYPVQLLGREVVLEFIGEDGIAAPRLAELRPGADELADLWRQTLDALSTLARAGLAHGDLSPYNVLVHRGDLVLIDLPQVVDVVGNPQGPRFLERDLRGMATWFAVRGLPEEACDVERLLTDLLADAGLRS